MKVGAKPHQKTTPGKGEWGGKKRANQRTPAQFMLLCQGNARGRINIIVTAKRGETRLGATSSEKRTRERHLDDYPRGEKKCKANWKQTKDQLPKPNRRGEKKDKKNPALIRTGTKRGEGDVTIGKSSKSHNGNVENIVLVETPYNGQHSPKKKGERERIRFYGRGWVGRARRRRATGLF